MDFESMAELSFYETVASIDEEHKVFIVQHRESKKIYVKKILSVYNSSVYHYLKEHPLPGIPRIFCLFENNDSLTVIEEYISGNTIDEILQKSGPMPEAAVIKYSGMLCQVLNSLHNTSPAIVHRDIKPSNVIITDDGRVVLIDLNAARADISKEEDTTLLGTKGYAAPEQYGFGSSNEQTDIYALGMLINTMLWGHFERNPYSGSGLTPVVQKCLELNPADRYQTVLQVLKAIDPTVRIKTKNNNWRRFLPPGFRSGNVFNMFIATVSYIFFGWIFLDMEVDYVHPGALEFQKVLLCFTFLMVVACVTNYLNIQKCFPMCKSDNKLVRTLGITILTFTIAAACFLLLFLGEVLIFKM